MLVFYDYGYCQEPLAGSFLSTFG